jgi:glycosyltransferase involved in cell wall biosynthesis
MNQPRISIITVTFNAASVVERTIQSVVSQHYDNLEYLIIDGASKDATMQIVERYRERIERCGRIVSEPDKGLYDAMNKGARLATGEWILFLNADDVFVDPDVVADAAAFIREHPEADIVYGNTEQVWDFGTLISAPPQACRNHKMCISPQATFVRTALHNAHPFALSYRYAADFEQSISFVQEGRQFVHFDRLISRVELSSGVTHDNHYDSEKEIYEILLAKGFDVRRDMRRKLRHIQLVSAFRKHTPQWLSRPVFRLVAKYYKAM